MKLASLVAVLLFLPLLSHANLIGVGYHSPFAKVWRFYERDTRGELVPKILIYNTTGESITFCMKVTSEGRELRKSDMPLLQKYLGIDHDTVIHTVTIPAHGYGIYETESLPTNQSTGFYDAVIINGLGAGIMVVRGKLQAPDNRYRYYSSEGLDGTGNCMIGTNNLFTESGEPGHMSLYYKCSGNYNNYPVKEWQFEPGVEQGIATITLCKEDGQCYTAGSGKPGAKFPVNIEKIDSFKLEADYVVSGNASFPELYLIKYFCNHDCSISMVLPVFLKQP